MKMPMCVSERNGGRDSRERIIQRGGKIEKESKIER